MFEIVFNQQNRNRTWRSQQPNSAFDINCIETKKKEQEATQIEVPNFEATDIFKDTFGCICTNTNISTESRTKVQNEHSRINSGDRNDTKRLV